MNPVLIWEHSQGKVLFLMKMESRGMLRLNVDSNYNCSMILPKFIKYWLNQKGEVGKACRKICTECNQSQNWDLWQMRPLDSLYKVINWKRSLTCPY
jgi:hypothetical protein